MSFVSSHSFPDPGEDPKSRSSTGVDYRALRWMHVLDPPRALGQKALFLLERPGLYRPAQGPLALELLACVPAPGGPDTSLRNSGCKAISILHFGTTNFHILAQTPRVFLWGKTAIQRVALPICLAQYPTIREDRQHRVHHFVAILPILPVFAYWTIILDILAWLFERDLGSNYALNSQDLCLRGY